MIVEIKLKYPEDERIDVARWLRDAADTVRDFVDGDDYYAVTDMLDNGVVRDFKIMEDRHGQAE